ncbi:MAG: helix-turn-helix domain-containing protein, partial [Planctomycetes bacterium]|nr:helix-turn-helix domain-containing protein [Planctomycetota bacterium]
KVTDEDVFAAAQRAMSRRGPHELTLADIAAEAGVTPGRLVQRFGSKRALLVALSERVRLAAAAGADSSFRERACRLLAAHPEPGFALAAAARELGLSEQQFRKRFAREVGMPPGRWHQRRRIERATQLLTSMPVAEVARQLGYSDRTAFSRQFRQATGMPPRSLRAERD